MSRFLIDKNPNKALIIRDIASGSSDEAIARKYGLRDSRAVAKYRQKVLPEIARLSSYSDASGLLAAISDNIARVDRMLEGLEKWATDPEDPALFAMDPRADEIYVIYTKATEGEDGRIHYVRLKENLQDAIMRFYLPSERETMRLETKKADQRIVLLKAMDTMARNLELLISARESLSGESTDEAYRAGLEDLMETIQRALRPYPEAMEALTAALMNPVRQGDVARSDDDGEE